MSARRLAAAALAALLSGCGGDARPAAAVAGGDVDAGRAALVRYGCTTCHMVPGVRGADAVVGPPLTGWSRRGFIAGSLVNTPENLVGWIMNPQIIEPGTAMPDLGVTESDARDMAAYLFTLR